MTDSGWWQELKRRNVVRVGIAYAVMGWIVAQAGQLVFEIFEAPAWIGKVMLAVIALGLPFALFFAWAYELTPEGIKKEKDVDRSQSITRKTGRKLDFVIIGVLVVALGYFVVDKFLLRGGQDLAAGSADVADAAQLAGDQTDDQSIAVLPFENRSNNDDDAFFTSGIHDDLLTQLAQIASLRVVSRTSVAQFKDTTLSIREIAERLGVATILEGGVQRAGNQVRINMQLIDADTDAHLWAQTYDRELTASNIFKIQSEVATAVTDALRAALSPEEQSRLAAVPTQNLQALEEYFKGRAGLDQRTRASIEAARTRFERARELDPSFAQAWAGEAQAILLLKDSGTSYGDIPAGEATELARPLLDRALELAPDDAQVLGIYGLLETDIDLDKALEYLNRSVALNPSSGEVLNWQRMAQFRTGRLRQANETSKRMVEVDPMSMIALYNHGFDLARMGRADTPEMEMVLKRLDGMNRSWGLSVRAGIESSRGNIVEAIRILFGALHLSPDDRTLKRDLLPLLAGLGLYDEVLQLNPEAADTVAFISGDWARAQELLADEPDPKERREDQFDILAASGDAQAAYPLALEIWEEHDDPFLLGFDTVAMSWVAAAAGHAEQARRFGEIADRWLQSLADSGAGGAFRYQMEAIRTVTKGRNDAAIAAIEKAIDKGYRWQLFLSHPMLDPLRGDARFEAQVERMARLIETERDAVVAMLCGPDAIETAHQPADATCDLLPQTD